MKYQPGEVYGRLTILKDASRIDPKYRRLLCQCLCGNETVVLPNNLQKGNTLSCGCLQVENTRRVKTTHGCSSGSNRTSEYRSWQAMKRRCFVTTDPKYPRYGGRGITVCTRWLESFENFLSDMGSKPSSKHTIDRFPNNDGNYEPGNCRWATQKEQGNNRSTNQLFTLGNESMSLSAWAEKYGLSPKLVRQRIVRQGWSLTKALEQS